MWDRQLRWAQGTRYSRPWGHVGSGLVFAMPYGILGLIAAADFRTCAIRDGAIYGGAFESVARMLGRGLEGCARSRLRDDRSGFIRCEMFPVS